MADNRGGYRQPAKPAPVSGPGALSQRTDGGPADKQAASRLPDAKYGEQAEFQALQGGAPMAEAARPSAPPVIPFSDPSARPDEPVTFGADAGEGPGMDALGLDSEERGDLEQLVASGTLPWLEWYAARPDASPSFRAFVRRIKSKI